MMAYVSSGSALNNFGTFISKLQPQAKTVLKKLERILKL